MKNSSKNIHDLGPWRICRCRKSAESYSATRKSGLFVAAVQFALKSIAGTTGVEALLSPLTEKAMRFPSENGSLPATTRTNL
jgi:hypothetical protein